MLVTTQTLWYSRGFRQISGKRQMKLDTNNLCNPKPIASMGWMVYLPTNLPYTNQLNIRKYTILELYQKPWNMSCFPHFSVKSSIPMDPSSSKDITDRPLTTPPSINEVTCLSTEFSCCGINRWVVVGVTNLHSSGIHIGLWYLKFDIYLVGGFSPFEKY